MPVRPRPGQGTFRVAVTEAYDGACAVTTEHSLPVLEAAHIRPYGEGGAHDVANGLLLRHDVHRLFDLGYVTVAGTPVRGEQAPRRRVAQRQGLLPPPFVHVPARAGEQRDPALLS